MEIKLNGYNIAPIFDMSLLDESIFDISTNCYKPEIINYYSKEPLKLGDENFIATITLVNNKVTWIELKFPGTCISYNHYRKFLLDFLGTPSETGGIADVTYCYDWGKVIGINDIRTPDAYIEIQYKK